MSAANLAKEYQSALVLGSVATILFGLAAVFWPSLTLLTLLYLFSAYVIVSGAINVITGLHRIEYNQASFLAILLGLFELVVGVYFLRHTHVVFTTFILLIGLVLAARGVVEILVTYFKKNVDVKSQLVHYLVGLLTAVAGIVVLYAKEANGVTFVWILGVYALVVGTVHIAEMSRPGK